VKLGLFDQDTAMQKFETWNASHEVIVADRQDSHKKAKAASRIQPIIKKVEEAPVAVAVEEAPVAEEVVAETPAVEEVVAETPAVEVAPETEAPAADAETPAAE
jgi:small subunit ribosomal protein S16